MKLNVFGKHIEVVRCNNKWKAYYLGNEGKKRLAEDIVIPSDIEENELPNYMADLCHEWASQNRDSVTTIG
jgi:hypothetical protein